MQPVIVNQPWMKNKIMSSYPWQKLETKQRWSLNGSLIRVMMIRTTKSRCDERFLYFFSSLHLHWTIQSCQCTILTLPRQGPRRARGMGSGAFHIKPLPLPPPRNLTKFVSPRAFEDLSWTFSVKNLVWHAIAHNIFSHGIGILKELNILSLLQFWLFWALFW